MGQQHRWQGWTGGELSIALITGQGILSQRIEGSAIAPQHPRFIQALVRTIAQVEVDFMLKQQQFMIRLPQTVQLQEQKKKCLDRLFSGCAAELFLISGEPEKYDLDLNLKTGLNPAIGKSVAAQTIELKLQYLKGQVQYTGHHPAWFLVREQLRLLQVNYQQVSNLLATQIDS